MSPIFREVLTDEPDRFDQVGVVGDDDGAVNQTTMGVMQQVRCEVYVEPFSSVRSTVS